MIFYAAIVLLVDVVVYSFVVGVLASHLSGITE